MKKNQKYPPGWNENRVRKVIAHHEHQTEDEQAAEIEQALKSQNITMVAVPTPLGTAKGDGSRFLTPRNISSSALPCHDAPGRSKVD
jgi:hypothetical protein